MEKLYNISNHPSDKWSEEQREYFGKTVEIVDVPFPAIDPEASGFSQSSIRDMLSLIDLNAGFGRVACMVQGELSFSFQLILEIQARGIMCYVATTARNTIENPDGTKTVEFKFVRFRPVQSFYSAPGFTYYLAKREK